MHSVLPMISMYTISDEMIIMTPETVVQMNLQFYLQKLSIPIQDEHIIFDSNKVCDCIPRTGRLTLN
jgi:hypothetical protein